MPIITAIVCAELCNPHLHVSVCLLNMIDQKRLSLTCLNHMAENHWHDIGWGHRLLGYNTNDTYVQASVRNLIVDAYSTAMIAVFTEQKFRYWRTWKRWSAQKRLQSMVNGKALTTYLLSIVNELPTEQRRQTREVADTWNTIKSDTCNTRKSDNTKEIIHIRKASVGKTS